MKRRGYIISAVLLVIDLLCFAFGGVFIALAAIIYALGIGEHIARVKYRVIPCDPSLGVKHAKLDNCYQRVREKVAAEGRNLPNNIKVCLIPGDEMNAYCFGARSIGVTEGALSPKALMFINGQYMEIAIRKVVGDVLTKLEKKYGKQFKLYANTKVATVDGKLKNEFDLIIENVTDALVYVIEIKSGKQFRDYDKLARIGREYGIVPNRLLLVQNYLTTEQMETVEYFCEYYCANLEQDNLEHKLITMLENDL